MEVFWTDWSVWLKNIEKPLGYTINDIKGTSPFIVTCSINVDPDATPSIDGQRRLNPNIKKVVQKEVLKL